MNVRNTVVGAVAVVAVAGGILAAGHEAANGLEPTEVRTVTVRNDCPDGVWLFYGPNEPVAVDAVNLGGNGSTAQPMLESDVVWLLDQDRKALDRATVEASTTTVVLDASCRSIDIVR